MTFEEIQQRLAAKFGERVGALAPANKDPFVVVPAADVVEICRFAKDDEALAFDCLMKLSSVDWPKKNQIEVVYHLWSYRRRHGFVLKVDVVEGGSLAQDRHSSSAVGRTHVDHQP